MSPSVAAPVDDGQVHWGWLGGVAASEDKGLWPQRASLEEGKGEGEEEGASYNGPVVEEEAEAEAAKMTLSDDGPVEMLQVDTAGSRGSGGRRGSSGGRRSQTSAGEKRASERARDTSKAWVTRDVVEMGSWVGVGLAVVVVLVEMRRRRRLGGGSGVVYTRV